MKYLLSCLLAAFSFPAAAVMAPNFEAMAALQRIETVQAQRAQASHVLLAEVTQVQVTRTEGNQCPSREDWVVEAKVISSLRGDVRTGTSIRLQYDRELYRCPGPIRENIPELQTGQRLEAYLACQTDMVCTPAARAASFMDEQQFTQELQKRRQEFEKYAAKEAGPRPPPQSLQTDKAVFFKRGSLQLQPADVSLLEPHVKYLKEEPRARVRLLSYAEHTMTREMALAISERRATVVLNYLVKNGIAPERIDTVAFGRELLPNLPADKLTGRSKTPQGVVVMDYVY